MPNRDPFANLPALVAEGESGSFSAPLWTH
ncbi:hypothetical protein SAMN04488540_11539 [Ferrimonas sediminum]|uniref:Uncharacterized protein n=1 Tax=Ferrimonas sediminum TaxID=718193 RepID=A0A1G8XHL5_9GAMM|nr:hypothetical protein SAMN04488540_11539 [Ferrimonas sediminum]